MKNMRLRNILVVGGTGFVGSYVVNRLVKQGFRPLVLGRNFNRSAIIRKLINERKIVPIKCDLSSPGDIHKIGNRIKSVEMIVYLAQKPVVYKDITEITDRVYRELFIGTINLLEKMRNLKGACFISSYAVYQPDCTRRISESHPYTTSDLYGITKLTLELYLTIYSKCKDIPLTILRLSSVYGPEDTRQSAINIFLKSALCGKQFIISTNKQTFRDYVYVEDAASAVVASVKRNIGGVFNIGTGKKTNIVTLAEKVQSIAKIKNRKIKFKPERHAPLCYVLDISKAKKYLGFNPKTGMDEGLSKTFAWNRKINK